MSLAVELKKIVRGEVEDAPAVREHFSRDASLFRVMPEVVVRPRDAKDVCALVEYVGQQKTNNPKSKISITPRSAGTDMSGGPLGDSIVLDMTAHFDQVLEVGSSPDASVGAGYAYVEPGVYFRDFDKATQAKGLELPSYTASREINTVGGMVGNDSGGEKNLKYGKTARYVEELEVVLADGRVHVLKNLEGAALQQKLQEPGFEGELYRSMSKLLSLPVHRRVIEAHKPSVSKNSAGFALWDLGDGVHSLNLARLIVGSQGSLGVITKIKFRLVRPQPFGAMVVLFVKNLAQLGELVPDILAYKPDSFESYDDKTFNLAVKYYREFEKQMGKGFWGLLWQFLPEILMALRGGVPKLVLLAEFRGSTQKEAALQAQRLAARVVKKDHMRVRVLRSDAEARKYWVVRRESFNLLRHKVRGLRTAPFIDDFVVRPSVLPEFLPKLEKILSMTDLVYTVAGHVGDGNFHIIPLIDPARPDAAKIIDELSHKVYDLVLEYKGSITGEHNDGLIRTPYVQKMFGREMLMLFMEVKKIFDPQNIFNPGKKVGTTFSDAIAKLDLPTSQKALAPER